MCCWVLGRPVGRSLRGCCRGRFLFRFLCLLLLSRAGVLPFLGLAALCWLRSGVLPLGARAPAAFGRVAVPVSAVPAPGVVFAPGALVLVLGLVLVRVARVRGAPRPCRRRRRPPGRGWRSAVFRLGGVLWLLLLLFRPFSLPPRAPPLSARSRVVRCLPCWSALAGLGPLGSSSPGSAPSRARRGSRPGLRGAPACLWRCGRLWVVLRGPGLSPAPCSGLPLGGRLGPGACFPFEVGCVVCLRFWRAPGCPVGVVVRVARRSASPPAPRCSGSCVPRCQACPPAVPPGAPLALVRCVPLAPVFCVCPLCGLAARVLASSGAGCPFAWCPACGLAVSAPARSRWLSSPPPPPLPGSFV